MLLLDLVRKYRNNCQDQLGVMFGVDQAAVCRYIRVADRILAAMLPTPH
ncbi:MAG: transposase family protein, partial [Aphanocapsa feldmannii 288cV]